jgi:small-conductance mechanosensitive channel
VTANSRQKSNILLYLVATIVVGGATFLFLKFFGHANGAHFEGWWRIPWLILLSLLVYVSIRVVHALLFDFAFRLRRGYEAPTLVRNIFTLVVFAIVFLLIFNRVYSEVNLGALFTTSAIFGVIIGLALQDTLGNFFAGISLHADRPFQVGDVIVVGPQRHTGVVEGITWRAVKIRTFQNHIVLVSNSMAAKESIEVCPRENLNARIVSSARCIPIRRPRRFTS